MTKTFIAGPDGLVGVIGESERTLLQGIMSSVISLLEPETDTPADPLEALVGWDDEVSVPTDPALRRLLPDGVKDDDGEALELRRLTERSVRQSKVGALRAASLMLDADELRLSLPQAELFARALNDVRLVLAERLGLNDPEAVEAVHEVLDSEDPESEDPGSENSGSEDLLAVIYGFTSALQQALVVAMLEQRQVQEES
ncbi:hypothetical protein FHU41_000999 [Psychromicrobium silvestre]|uniref:DUF2017 domain-containing protein n=1 Tax=Psychromicrobium silvestre TaxID=1645614 RepID=A0A7Y9LSI0_9MICC|nr:DUF2017 domain-containing protein [Psychromicrobium silvestre]NYE94778.1 hypothetical protein [Psychromicrobium silvestre]